MAQKIGFHHSEESKRKISENSACIWQGKHLPEETRKKISDSLIRYYSEGNVPWIKGRKHTEETKAKLRKPRKLKEGHTSWNKGLKESEESKKKRGKAISKALIGRKLSKEHRRSISKSLLGKTGKKARNWQGGLETHDRVLYRNARRRARRLNAEGSHTQEEWELLKKQYGYTCPACGGKESEIKLTEDHIVPLVKGGSDYIENIQPLCRSCNCSKHTKTIKFERSNS